MLGGFKCCLFSPLTTLIFHDHIFSIRLVQPDQLERGCSYSKTHQLSIWWFGLHFQVLVASQVVIRPHAWPQKLLKPRRGRHILLQLGYPGLGSMLGHQNPNTKTLRSCRMLWIYRHGLHIIPWFIRMLHKEMTTPILWSSKRPMANLRSESLWSRTSQQGPTRTTHKLNEWILHLSHVLKCPEASLSESLMPWEIFYCWTLS